MPRPRLNVLSVLLVGTLLSGGLEAAEDIPIATLRDWQFFNDAGWRALLQGDYPKAEARFKAAIVAVRPYEVHDRRLLARSYGDLARTLYHEKRYAEAEPLARWSLAVREGNPKVKSDSVVQSLYILAMIERAQSHFQDAEPLLKKALALQEKTLGPDHPDVAVIVDEQAGVAWGLGRNTEADRLYKRALAIRERQLSSEHPDVVESLDHYAAFLRQNHREAEAEPLEARIKAIHEAIAERAAQLKAMEKKQQQRQGSK